MSGVLERAASLFVEPARTRPEPPPAATAVAAPRALVLGTPADAVPLASALAGALRARFRGNAALVCTWDRGDSRATGAWASAGARRLSGWLAARELPAVARGRLAWLGLDADPSVAAATVRRLLGWLDVPVVTAIAGPRAAALDALHDEHDLLVLAHGTGEDGPDALGRIAAGDLTPAGRPFVVCEPLQPGVSRWLGRAGMARLPRTHPALETVANALRRQA